MKRSRIVLIAGFLILALLWPALAIQAQGTKADYDRALGLRDKLQGLALNIVDRSGWIEKTPRFWYRKSVKGGTEFVIMDASTLAKKPAFDHEKLAAALAVASETKVEAKSLPFTSMTFVDGEKAVEFEVGDWKYSCDLSSYVCRKVGPSERRSRSDQAAVPEKAKPSPNGQWEAFIRNHNLWLRSTSPGAKDEFPLSWEGYEGDSYQLSTIAWSPDSEKLAAYRVKPGYKRIIQFVESSPEDQVQPKYISREYPKPGDARDVEQPVLFHVDTRKQMIVDNALFPNAYSQTALVWRKDGRAFAFEYNQRGHQAYRIIEVDAEKGSARAVVNEEAKTFFCYYSKKYRYDLQDGREVIWMSERDGWNHLYLYDGATGRVKNQITRGEWVVRAVDKVDEEKRQIYFRAGGMVPGRDPYFAFPYRIDFDGSGLTPLADGEGSHSIAYSPDMTYYLDTWSRVDQPPTTVLRRVSDQKILAPVEKADIAELVKAGWRAPEAFVAKGRDGRTEIWGIIVRPSAFDAKKKYPVVEYIYAGPHSSFVPKTFSAYSSMQARAELGFIVAQIDGMGTSNRSKDFHDVAWKNIADAGFPDRILWHRAVAAKYPSYDISRAGIYGHSAGGQNTLTALLFHPDFYKAGVSSCGCHDNRMDKISWNEQWMGWPIGPEYAASSNVDNAWRLKGKLLLSVGELDTNVDPASTMQVVNALIKANKTFDLIVLPGQGHSSGGAYGDRKRYDFFVKNLLGIEPPDWNRIEK